MDNTGTTNYQYDSLGRVTNVSETRGALTFTQSYTYDLAGNIATITMPSGRVVTYTRNANGLVSNVAAPINGSATNLASSITYLSFGPQNAMTYGNAKTFSATYDTDYNPTNRTVSGGLYNWTYTTDKNSNITQAGATTYGYDALDRVNAENPGTAASYTYDATSNRLTKVQGGTTTTTVPSTSNKISAVGGTSYTYDAAGNITAIGTNGYVWNNQGLMKEYKISGVSTATYTYNAYNQRTKKMTGGVTTHYVYGAGGLMVGEYTTAGAMVREYVYLNMNPLAQVNSGSPETVTYIHVDHLGTPRFGTNSAGTNVWSWTNDAFGISSPSGAATINLRMAGQYYDSESSLFYNWNRYYNTAIGRYISSDPIGAYAGLNTFLYTGANPISDIDASGLLGVIKTDDDREFTFNTSDEFLGSLNQLGKGKITELSLYGHANPTAQAIDNADGYGVQDAIELYNGEIFLVDDKKRIALLKDLLENKLAPDALINLTGCKTAGDPESGPSLAQAISLAFPDAVVKGSPYPTLRAGWPFNSTAVGYLADPLYFQNGVPSTIDPRPRILNSVTE